MIIYGNPVIGPMILIRATTTGFRAFGWPLRVLAFCGHLPTGDIAAVFMDFTPVTGGPMLDFTAVLIMAEVTLA
jgi:hypothetical protein